MRSALQLHCGGAVASREVSVKGGDMGEGGHRQQPSGVLGHGWQSARGACVHWPYSSHQKPAAARRATRWLETAPAERKGGAAVSLESDRGNQDSRAGHVQQPAPLEAPPAPCAAPSPARQPGEGWGGVVDVCSFSSVENVEACGPFETLLLHGCVTAPVSRRCRAAFSRVQILPRLCCTIGHSSRYLVGSRL